MRWLCIALLFGVTYSTAAAREWTDSTGQFRREAELLYERDGQVWLQADGKTYAVPLARLSAADQAYVAQVGSAAESAGRAPDAPVKTLAYRKQDGNRVAAELQKAVTAASVARLTGWHCYGGHCHVVTGHHCPPTPPPSPPSGPKRIYHGCYSTFHLVTRVPNQVGGSGAYKFWVGGTAVEYLQLLKFTTFVAPWLLYEVDSATPPLNISHWLFKDVAVAPCWYEVYYYSQQTGYVFYEYACRRVPR